MTQVSSITIIGVPAKIIWHLIADFGASGQYLAAVIDCTVEGEGVGAVRMLTSTDGSTVAERLETLEAATQRLSYTLLTNTPFGDCVTTMSVRDLGPNQSELVWSAIFQPAGIPANEAADLLGGALAANGLALRQLVEAGWK